MDLNKKQLKFFDMFSGIGGFKIALERAGFKCVGYCDNDKYATKLYREFFNTEEEMYFDDATTIRTDTLPDFEILCAGFPCQAFSIAGKRLGFEDTRGTLFFEIARILQHKRPRYLLLENVKGLLSHEHGKTFQTILKVLSNLGYILQWEVLNSKNFGVPQNRERVFIIGHLRGTRRPEVFPIREGDQDFNEMHVGSGWTKPETAISGCIGEKQDRQHNTFVVSKMLEITKDQSQGYRVYDTDGISTTLAAEGGGMGAKTGLYQLKDTHIRRLTPTECERLQGFPDGWTEGISNTQRYKCLGNAVTTTVITEIGKRLLC